MIFTISFVPFCWIWKYREGGGWTTSPLLVIYSNQVHFRIWLIFYHWFYIDLLFRDISKTTEKPVPTTEKPQPRTMTRMPVRARKQIATSQLLPKKMPKMKNLYTSWEWIHVITFILKAKLLRKLNLLELSKNDSFRREFNKQHMCFHDELMMYRFLQLGDLADREENVIG